jgi:hypothetical protein
LRQESGRCLQAQNDVTEKLAGTWGAGRDLQQGKVPREARICWQIGRQKLGRKADWQKSGGDLVV